MRRGLPRSSVQSVDGSPHHGRGPTVFLHFSFLLAGCFSVGIDIWLSKVALLWWAQDDFLC